jgi:hypothetical protein
MNLLNFNIEVKELYNSISQLIIQAKTRVAITANAETTILNWKVGVFINDFVLEHNRAEYGKEIIANISLLLTQNIGSGWSSKHLFHCLRSAETIKLDTS